MFVRQVVRRDFDEVTAQIEELRRDLHARQLAAGATIDPRGIASRRAEVLRLRDEGLSERAIARAVGVSRGVVTHDLLTVGAKRPSTIIGLDGRRTHGP
jgi:DNA-binding NarL/FixJ family response regulator